MKRFTDTSPDLVVMVTTASDCIERGHGVLAVLCVSVTALILFQCVKAAHRKRKERKKRGT